ncbi:hypothetical protein ACKRZS_005479 [Fusarium odoratissimum]
MDTEGKFMDMEEYKAISAKAAQPQKVMEEEKSESRRRELLQSLESTRLTQTPEMKSLRREGRHALKQFLQSQGHRFVGNRRVKGMVPKLAARIGPSSNLCLFAKVYALGEKYGIPGLKAIALGKFEILAKGHFQTDGFRLAVQEVYASTIDHDRGLRDVVVCTIEENIGLLNDEAFEAVVKYSDLGHDLLMKITSMRRAG